MYRSWPYLFIFILKITLTAKIYPSPFLLRCMSTLVPVHQYTCSVYFFIFGITCTVTFPLICWDMYTQIIMLLLCLRTKTYLSPQLLVYLPLNVPDHDPASSFSYFKYSICLTAKIYPSTFYCSTCPQIYPFMSIPVQYFSLFGITYTVKFPLIF